MLLFHDIIYVNLTVFTLLEFFHYIAKTKKLDLGQVWCRSAGIQKFAVSQHKKFCNLFICDEI